MASVIIIFVCLLASAFFSGSETALLRLRDTEADESRGPSAFAIRDLLKSTSRLLVTILLGNNVVNILGASVAAAFAVAHLGPEFGVVASTLVMTVLVLVFCEILPKAVAAAHPQGVSHGVALPLYLIHQGLRPIHGLFDRAVEPVVRRITGGVTGEAPITAEEVMRLARRARIEQAEGTPLAIIAAAAQAGQMTVDEIMVTRPQIFAFPVDTPPAELLDRVLDERYTRVPIYDGNIDNVLGVVHLKDLMKAVRGAGAGDDLREILKPVLRVPERKPILRLLAEMQRLFIQVAIVKDEHGLTQGIVTTEDILEELVGEIRDEFDQEELQSVSRQLGGDYEALGRVLVLDFNRATGWEIPAERGDTLAGLVFNELGRGPRRGDVVRIGEYEIGVGEVSGTRIARVRVRRVPKPEEPDEAPNGAGRA